VSGDASGGRSSAWRFIDSGFLPGSYNMAADMAMTLAAARGEAPATLRVYNWARPTISLGCHQSELDIDLDRCREAGIAVVYRPTGGRAILHHNEVTYAVVLPPSSPFYAPEIQRVYEFISRCLVRALRLLDIDADFERIKKSPSDFARGELSTLCYASSIQYEITISGRKLAGSAQRRINHGILQHGSILVGDEHLNITRYLAVRDEPFRQRVREYMEKNTISLQQVSKALLDKSQLVHSLRRAFAEELDILFFDASLSDHEHREALSLQSKFAVLDNVV
jgi:lipoyl(octanoyl) transferase